MCVFECVCVSYLWLQLAQESVDETFWSNPEHVWIWMELGDVLRIQFSDGLTLLFRSNMMVGNTKRQWAHRVDHMQQFLRQQKCTTSKSGTKCSKWHRIINLLSSSTLCDWSPLMEETCLCLSFGWHEWHTRTSKYPLTTAIWVCASHLDEINRHRQAQ